MQNQLLLRALIEFVHLSHLILIIVVYVLDLCTKFASSVRVHTRLDTLCVTPSNRDDQPEEGGKGELGYTICKEQGIRYIDKVHAMCQQKKYNCVLYGLCSVVDFNSILNSIILLRLNNQKTGESRG